MQKTIYVQGHLSLRNEDAWFVSPGSSLFFCFSYFSQLKVLLTFKKKTLNFIEKIPFNYKQNSHICIIIWNSKKCKVASLNPCTVSHPYPQVASQLTSLMSPLKLDEISQRDEKECYTTQLNNSGFVKVKGQR